MGSFGMTERGGGEQLWGWGSKTRVLASLKEYIYVYLTKEIFFS